MKKFIIFVSSICMIFSSCKYNKNIPDVTTTFSAETTSLTLTELFEEDNLISESGKINIGIFDPFSDKTKINKNIETEIYEAMHKISDAYAFMNASPRTFAEYSEYHDSFAETDEDFNRYSGSKKFYPINENYAKSEDELFNNIRAAFTENYISDEELKSVLFNGENNSGPNYKTVDGKLCIKGGIGKYISPIGYKKIFICSCNDDTAEIIARSGYNAAGNTSYYITLKRTSKYGWRADSCEIKDFYYDQAAILYSALYLKTDKLNMILGGGNMSSEETIIDGRRFYKTDINMSIEEMREFFSEIFCNYIERDPHNEIINGNGSIADDNYVIISNMLSDNTDKYINNVYYEKDGVIYRYKYAPKYYLPKIQIDVSRGYAAQLFYDENSKEYIEYPVSVETVQDDTCIENEYISLFISSELPIRETDENNAANIEIEEPELFPDAIKLDDKTTAEIYEALGKISDSRAMLYANITGFRKQDNTYFGDLNNVLERNDKEEYTYAPIDQEYASNFDELTNQMRAVFTENFISDEEMQKTLFESDRNVPEYKMIDGKLCALHQYMGVMTTLIRDDFKVISYDEKTADIICYAEGLDMPYDFSIVKLVNSDEYGWRLDHLEFKENYPKERNIVYNALLLKTEKLNKIFSGGNIPENAETIEINGEIYTETDLDLSIKDMVEFFIETFSPTKFRKENADVISDYVPSDILRENYIKKYISDVYYEKDGVIFRKNSAARYYVPEAVFDPFIKAYTYGYCSSPYDGNGAYYEFNMPFLKTDGNVTSENIAFSISIAATDEKTGKNYYTYLNIASEIPLAEIKENS